jgi:uncharacterized protein (DUF58 family)
MLSKDMIKKIKHIEIKSNKVVEEIFSGEYQSNFKGNGMEFSDIRQYYPGDDVRNIDWNVTARHNKAYVKQFCEERELNMFLLIDMSMSNRFGSKKDYMAEVGATLALSAVKNNDRVGMILFTNQVERFIPSKKGRKHVLSLIETILSHEPEHKGTNIKEALNYFNKIEKKRCVVFLISDFLDDDYQQEIKMIGSKHDLILVRITDPKEEQLPGGAIYTFEDLETGEIMVIDNLKGKRNLNQKNKQFSKNTIDLYTNEDYVKRFKHFFRRKIQR